MYPDDLFYTRDHEWIKVEDGIGTVGITDYAQGELGDIVYIELPEGGKKIETGDVIGSIESVKAVSEIYAPVSGDVEEVNESLADEPGLVNEDPHGEGWLVRMRVSDPEDLKSLLSATDYEKYIREEARDS